MGFGSFELPTGECRFTGEHLSLGTNQKVYIDPSIWCIHGRYEAFGKYIVTKSNVTAHLAQIHPFTFGWISDTHFGNPKQEWISNAQKGIDVLGSCNPTLTVVGGDIVEPSLEGLWFEDTWNYMKDKLSNNLWIKGNHDVGGEELFCYHYYDWFERLWCLGLGNFKFIGFDTYNERVVLPGSCDPGISLHDLIWFKKRLHEDSLYKVMLFHHPLSQWWTKVYPFALDEASASNTKCAFFGHDSKIPYEEILGIPCYNLDGEVNPAQPALSIFTKSGDVYTIRVKDNVEIAESSDAIEIKAPAISWKKEEVKSIVPTRLVRHLKGRYINLIALCLPENLAHIQITDNQDDTLMVRGDIDMYIIGKEIYSTDDAYDSWECSCGMTWNSYYINAEKSLELRLSR